MKYSKDISVEQFESMVARIVAALTGKAKGRK